MNQKITSIRLDQKLRERATKISDATGLDMTSVLRFAIKASFDHAMTASKEQSDFVPDKLKTPEFEFLVSAHRMKNPPGD